MASEQPQVVEAKPTLKEQIMGQAMAINGALTGRKEKTAAGEALYTGTQAPSTDAKIEQMSGRSIDELNVHRPTGGQKATETEGKI